MHGCLRRPIGDRREREPRVGGVRDEAERSHAAGDRTDFERDIVADLRNASGRDPGGRALTALINQLLGSSPRFAAIWAEAKVTPHVAGKKPIQTSLVGPITLDCEVSPCRVATFGSSCAPRRLERPITTASICCALLACRRSRPPPAEHGDRGCALRQPGW